MSYRDIMSIYLYQGICITCQRAVCHNAIPLTMTVLSNHGITNS